ncbi:hypothetical protein [Agromyces flavus]|uniref:Uncharacterized protein n=1 Tax=Agromyces flavus TaxID=589382 RepID=A0A1H1ZZB5_9MICO|nr:hypothetical protein [Agromyces flavus]GGI45924.1 hypothetical protein GCM10010932_12020 [Agromyces flavus]SDT38762.1 hypothetical protein SAMN04489721_3417 [Agromyces flavus]
MSRDHPSEAEPSDTGSDASSDRALAAEDDRRADAFWSAFDSAAPEGDRWMDSATAAWRPHETPTESTDSTDSTDEPPGSADR